jgi:hypothetical protein
MYQHLPEFVSALAKHFDIGVGTTVQSVASVISQNLSPT